jgi:hypothetical protein
MPLSLNTVHVKLSGTGYYVSINDDDAADDDDDDNFIFRK